MMLDAFHDEEGMTTVGMVLALLVTPRSKIRSRSVSSMPHP